MIRIGNGFDMHAFAPENSGRRLVLCGVEIPFDRGLAGHSDADVATHAICDAFLGAAALGDIGKFFPDTDPKYKGIYSIELLRQVIIILGEKGFRPGNIDCTLICEKPRLAGHIEAMREKIAGASNLPVGNISVKATTTERLGAAGRGEGIAAIATVIISDSGFGG